TINFQIPVGQRDPSGVFLIKLVKALTLTKDRVTINGYSQPPAKANTKTIGTDASLLIQVDGRMSPDPSGFVVTGKQCTIKGLVIGVFRTGIELQSSDNMISGNFIGLKANGTDSLLNATGILINNVPNNTVGGLGAGSRNVISGNGIGVRILGMNA